MLRKIIFAVSLAGLVLCFIYSNSYAAEYPIVGSIIGEQFIYQIKDDDSFPEIARKYDLGYDAICNANPDFDPFIPEQYRLITIPAQWILPDVEIQKGIVINLAEMRLYFFLNGNSHPVITFPVGIGDEGKDTPLGIYTIIEKTKNPAWYVPKSIQLEKPDLPDIVPPGTDNPMGSRALRLSNRTYLIHGTNRPWGIGTRNSHGCIRLYEEDIVQLFDKVDIGTRVAIVNQQIKIAVAGKQVYMEVHVYENGSDLNGEALKIIEAKRLMDSVDLEKVKKAVIERSGLLVDVSKQRTDS